MGELGSRAEASRIAERLRPEGRIIVTTNGSFDLLRAGHLRYLREGHARRPHGKGIHREPAATRGI